MSQNARLFHTRDTRLALYATLQAGDLAISPSRVCLLRWDTQAKTKDLLARLQHPLPGERTIPEMFPVDAYRRVRSVIDLPTDKQTSLRSIWERRIIGVLSNSTFDVDATVVGSALGDDGLLIHYFLVARHNSAEMGHVDVVKLVITDSKGTIIARTKPEYSLDYPLGFCEERQWTYDFLF